MSLGLTFILGYIFFIGIGTFLQKTSLKQLTPFQLEFLIALGMLIVSIPALLIAQKSFYVPIKEIPMGGLVGLLFSAASLLFTLALSKMDAALASTLSITYVLVVVILSAVFLKEPFSLFKLLGIMLTLTGVGILYFQK